MKNPFQYGKVVEQPYFTDREEIFQEMSNDIEAGNNLILYSPRRYGKTSLLLKLSKDMKQKGFNSLYIDFYKVISQRNFIETYNKSIVSQIKKPMAGIIKKISSLVRGITPSLSFDTSGNPVFSLNFLPQGDLPQTLDDTLNLPEKLSDGKRWLIIFDEFQEIVSLNGDSFANQLRSVIQFHKNCVYVFSGSKQHMLLNMFNSPQQALYRFGKVMNLNKIDAGLMSAFLMERFISTNIILKPEIANQIIYLADNIPNYVQYLASETWQICQQNDIVPTEEIVRQAIENLVANLQDYFYQIWEALSHYQKKVLEALVQENANPFSKNFQEKYQLSSTSGTQRAIEKLIEVGLVKRENEIYTITDPFLQRFIALRILA